MRNFNAVVGVLLALGVCLACARDASRPTYASVAGGAGAGAPKADSSVPAAPKAEAPGAGAHQEAPSSSSSEAVASAATRFSLDVTKKVLQAQRGNCVVSPLGVAVLLSLLQQGCDLLSDTSMQLEQGLHLHRDTAAKGLPLLLRNAVTKEGSKSQLETGNRLFVGVDNLPKSAFLKTARTSFDSEVTTVDFKRPDEAAASINRWASEATHGHIPALVSAGSLSARSSVVLASAMYFRGVWKYKFDMGKTMQRLFSTSPSQNVTVFMMAQVGDFRTGELLDLDAQWLELPFDGEHFSMVLVLPNKRHGLDAVLTGLSAEDISNVMDSQIPLRRTLVLVPRFQLNSDVSLTQALKQLGMKAMFSARHANLKDIAEHPVTVSGVVHKAEMSVDERGATASAASAVLVNTLSLVSLSEDMKFYADQPFLTIIMDRISKVPLFIGRVTLPTSEF